MTIKTKLKMIVKDSLSVNKLSYGKLESVLLTFDDGPMINITCNVLNIIAQYNIKAIFYVVGKYINGRQDILKAIADAGHEIGNHSYCHYNDKEPSFIEYYNDVRKCQYTVKSVTGYAPRYFRPPRGILSLKSIIVAKMLGLKIMLWSLDANDWRCNNNNDAKLVADSIINSIQNDDILLLHDNNEYILPILNAILPELIKYNLRPTL